jgi:multidrug resistance efflux pump
MKNTIKILLTSLVVGAAVAALLFKYWHYIANPWTRDGQVRAQVIQVSPRISGPIVKLPIVDNQEVKAGDLLFVIDPRTYQSAVDDNQAALAQAKVNVEEEQDLYDRAVKIRKSDKGAMSEQQVIKKHNSLLAAQQAATSAQAQLDDAKLNLEFTEVRASVDGYVTNLNLRIGSQAVENQPSLALVDKHSFWIHGFFRETLVGDIHPGDSAVVTLMTYPDTPLSGKVDSLGWGIAQEDGSTGFDLLPTINATFEWIRLAQRVPVRVHLDQVPDGIDLRVGTTASVLVMTGGDTDTTAVPPTPAALQ